MSYEALYNTAANAFGTKPTALLVAQLSQILPQGRVLDIGAGQGRNALFLAEKGFDVVAVEPTVAGTGAIRERAEALGLSLSVEEKRIQDFDGEAESFNAVIAIGLFPMLAMSEVRLLIKRIDEWLSPGGVVIIAAFTTEDPSFEVMKAQSVAVERNVLALGADGHLSYFDPGELAEVFVQWESVHYAEEKGKMHRHGEGPLHHHHSATGVFRKR